jgi:hypothetical protein
MGRDVGAWVRCWYSGMQSVPGGVVGVRFYEKEVVAALLSMISQSTPFVCMGYLLSPFGAEPCRSTFRVFRLA